MKKVSVAGYPRIGKNRELKKWTEEYFKGEITKSELLENAAGLKKGHWLTQLNRGVNLIPSNDFSFYDTFLDTAFMLNAVPERYRKLGLDGLDTYFAMAKGYQGEKGDVRALPMKKWFNTNYHYIVPEIDDATAFRVNSEKPFDEYKAALSAGIRTKPVLIGPFTFLRLSDIRCKDKTLDMLADRLVSVYQELLKRFDALHVEFVQLDEPGLVADLTEADIGLFQSIYGRLLKGRGALKILLQTYFGDVRDIYPQLTALGFDALGLDFVEGPENERLLEEHGFPKDTLLFAGVVDGRNIWLNDYSKTLALLRRLARAVDPERLVLGTSCSLLHVPYTVGNETRIDGKVLGRLAFAEEKLSELNELSALFDDADFEKNEKFIANGGRVRAISGDEFVYEDVRRTIAGLKADDFTRKPAFCERRKIQKEALGLPLLPTTTIGSFPQTPDIRSLRSKYKSGKMERADYEEAIKAKIGEAVRLQEELGLDVLAHGEFERNDMVEYFGERLSGFLFTQNGWVQSYGTRCVKPPILFGDVKRLRPMTVETSVFAQSLTKKPVKGMLTGPVTILNWSFVREDLPQRDIALQLALAVREEALDLERAGIRIIQIDEAALREKLPLRKRDWRGAYLDWAIPAFRLVHSGLKPGTQVHTHMCYSEFSDIIRDIDGMDADVITFEAAKSDLSILRALRENGFRTEVGPGVYDIHSPRVPGVGEIKDILRKILRDMDAEKVWVNPDCGLKTRGTEETVLSLKNMVTAASELRDEIGKAIS